MARENLETVKGIVRVITHKSEDNDFVIAKIEPPDGGKRIAVKGWIKHLSVGETVVLKGYWTTDKKWGPTFKFESYESVLPSSLDGIKHYLSSRYMKNIGPITAERIVNTFGTDTLRILDEEPDRIKEVPGISRKQIASIKSGWEKHRHIRDVMIFLRAHDISEAYASRIYEKYGEATVDKMRSNPYCLIRDIRGIGFIKADLVATKLGIAKDAPDRVRAGILHTIDELTDKGHVFVPYELLVDTAAETLDLDAAAVTQSLEKLAKSRFVIVEEGRVYPAELYTCETEVAQMLKSIAGGRRGGKIPERAELDTVIADIESKRGISFAEGQRDAIALAASSTLMVLTGGPGTGKTTTVLGIIDIFRRLRIPTLLCAPTGRAAKRMTEATGIEAKTIHRLLEYNPHNGRFTRTSGNPLSAGAIIMDEASMVDTRLMADFLRAVGGYTSLVIVGDVDQLPSIGPGSILRDIIISKSVPTVRLTEIFRQAQTSGIVRSAHLINAGRMPHTGNEHDGNFFFISMKEPGKIAESIVDMVSRRLPVRYGFDPISDIQVLSPMHKSETGVQNLNVLLQERLNPPNKGRSEIRRSGWTFREGDKVMQVRNNYDKMVFNGDIGRIVRIVRDRNAVRVKFDEIVEFEGSELDDLVPAYAVSVHKSQGSEFKCVVMPVTTQHFIMLKRNLLYTAVTRARELAVLVGDFRALAIAVKNEQISERNTSLAERLMT